VSWKLSNWYKSLPYFNGQNRVNKRFDILACTSALLFGLKVRKYSLSLEPSGLGLDILVLSTTLLICQHSWYSDPSVCWCTLWAGLHCAVKQVLHILLIAFILQCCCWLLVNHAAVIFFHIYTQWITCAFSSLTLLVGHQEEHLACKNWMVVICLEWGANDCIWSSWCHCHPIISCFIKIRIGLTFMVPAYPGCRGKEAVKRVSIL